MTVPPHAAGVQWSAGDVSILSDRPGPQMMV